MGYYISNLSMPMLVVFDAVCRLKNMTRAAEDVHISQPAVSRYMKELRAITGQTLFVKAADGIELTEEGHDLWRKAVEILNSCEYFTRYAEGAFNPEEQDKSFTVAVSLLNTSYFLEELVLNTRQNYPHIHIDLIHLNLRQAIGQLEAREISAYLGYDAKNLPSFIEKEEMKDVKFTVICSRHSPLYKQNHIGKKDFIEQPHIKVNTEINESFMDRELTRMGIFQNNLTDVPDMSSMNLMLHKTDMLFIAQREHAVYLCEQYEDLKILEPKGFSLPQTKTYLLWNRCNASYRPHVWLRNYIKKKINAA